MSKKTTVRILQRDINDKTCDRGNPGDCLIARAINRLLKRAYGCRVGTSSGTIRTRRGAKDWTGEVLANFDFPSTAGHRVFHARKPFSFKCDIPAEFLKQKRKAA